MSSTLSRSGLSTRFRYRASLVLMVASGFAGLGYQIVWTSQGALWLGHEAAAVLAVLTALFGGLALGAWALAPAIERSARPARWYAACEATIACWGLCLIFALSPFSHWVLALTGAQATPAWQWTVALLASFTFLLPATAAMGATLPAMERIASQWRDCGQAIAPLYAGNTLGAVLGVLASAFWLVPRFGLTRTAALCVGINALCALIALALWAKESPTSQPAAEPDTAESQRSDVKAVTYAVGMRLGMTGLLGIGYEVVVVRLLSQVFEDTVYTFALLLAVYLLGSALGAAAYPRWRKAARNPEALRDRLLCALATACLVGTVSLWMADVLNSWMRGVLGDGMAAALGAEAGLALLAFGPATVLMGALFSQLSTDARDRGLRFGRALGINTLGAATAPMLFGVVALPMLGPKLALLLIACGYLSLASRPAWTRSPTAWAAGASLAAAAGLAVFAPPLAFIDRPEGGRVVSYRDGVMAAVSVVEDAEGVARLRINNRQQEGSSSSLRVDGRQALLPVLLHPSPRRALFLGLGTGITASVAARQAGLQVDAVELLPEVIEASRYFTAPAPADTADSHPRLIAADARRFVRASDTRYDVIVSDNFHPARSGSGSLYTVEHFAAVRERLAENGLFCQWLPLHQLDLATLRSIVQSFLAVYPQGWALLASNSLETPVWGLVARRDKPGFDVPGLVESLGVGARAAQAAAFGVEDEFALLGSFVAGPKALARLAGDAALNTDDHPVVAYMAPRITYAPDSAPVERLVMLLRELQTEPAERLAAGAQDVWSLRLDSYRRARNRFIELGRGVRPLADPKAMLAQVREPLLAVLRISPDFRPAYDPLLRMAIALAPRDEQAARALLNELHQIQPDRPESAQALRQLNAAAP